MDRFKWPEVDNQSTRIITSQKMDTDFLFQFEQIHLQEKTENIDLFMIRKKYISGKTSQTNLIVVYLTIVTTQIF